MTTPDGPDSASERGRAMHPHERFRTAIDHREPDRVPIDLGGMVTGISTGASANLKAHLGIEEPDEIADRVQQLAIPHPEILERLHVDSRYLYLRASRDWQDVEGAHVTSIGGSIAGPDVCSPAVNRTES